MLGWLAETFLSWVFEIKLKPPAWIYGNDCMCKNKMA
jgi:hypothetical protein